MFVAPKPKDPGAKKWYRLVWSDWLGQNKIIAASWTVIPTSPPITVSDTLMTDQVTGILLDAGTDGVWYTCTCAIEADNGEKEEASILVKVAQQ